MSSAPPYMPYFVEDYERDTGHLSAAEDGVYMRLIRVYWRTQKPLPADHKRLARLARVTPDEWEEVADVIAEFFNEVDGEWRHKRIDAEIGIAHEKHEEAKRKGRAGADARWKKNGGAKGPSSSSSNASAKGPSSGRSSGAGYSNLGIGLGIGDLSKAASTNSARDVPTEAPNAAAAGKLIDAVEAAVIAAWGQKSGWRRRAQDSPTAEAWAAAGHTAEHVQATACRVFAKRRDRGDGPPKSIAYLADALTEPAGRGDADSPAEPFKPPTEAERVGRWLKGEHWPKADGPPPCDPGYTGDTDTVRRVLAAKFVKGRDTERVEALRRRLGTTTNEDAA